MKPDPIIMAYNGRYESKFRLYCEDLDTFGSNHISKHFMPGFYELYLKYVDIALKIESQTS